MRDAAEAEDRLLPQAVALVAAVELAGERAVLGVVFRQVGVEQVDRHVDRRGRRRLR